MDRFLHYLRYIPFYIIFLTGTQLNVKNKLSSYICIYSKQVLTCTSI